MRLIFASILLMTATTFALSSAEIEKYTLEFERLLDKEERLYDVKFEAPRYQAYDKELNSLIYKVNYEYYEEECSEAPTPSGDACGPVGEPVKVCEYAKFTPGETDFELTTVPCSWPLSELVDLSNNTEWSSQPYVQALMTDLDLDIKLGHLLSYKIPQHISQYENLDGTLIHLFKAVVELPEYNDTALVSKSIECQYIKYDHVESDFEYAGDCEKDIEDVIGGRLVDEL